MHQGINSRLEPREQSLGSLLIDDSVPLHTSNACLEFTVPLVKVGQSVLEQRDRPAKRQHGSKRNGRDPAPHGRTIRSWSMAGIPHREHEADSPFSPISTVGPSHTCSHVPGQLQRQPPGQMNTVMAGASSFTYRTIFCRPVP